MKRNHHFPRRALSLLLAVVLCMGLIPSAFAAQENGYHDPAEHWLTASNRTNELDVNAVVTHETFTCCVCEKKTSFLAWRTPEYTRDGVTALTRNVLYSDGTMVDGEGKGTILDGTPGKDAYYTGYHWTKAMCETCGTLNSNGGFDGYSFNKNVYNLYDCAAEFTERLPESVTYEYTDSRYHTKTTTGGTYCCFCYGTNHSTASVLERHTLETDILPQPANGRFAEVEHCTLCDYSRYDYTTAKAVIADYYGMADGQPHTISVTDLSESGVRASIRYGNSADACTLTSAPNYTEAGQYTVYYAITYTYGGESMTENGAAKVWLRDEAASEDGSGTCGDNHNYVLLDSVSPSCQTLGYDRYLCTECGKIEKRDYTAALGHSWQGVLIREATCEADGKLLEICSRCGEAKTTATPKGEHVYKTYPVAATCTHSGYTVRECEVCGDRHIEDITPALAHNYEAHVTPATCEAGGHTSHICHGCGSGFITDYTDALGHSWDKGTAVMGSTCTGEGMTEYRCVRCGAHRLEGDPASGHVPGEAATCTEPQLCTKCGAVIAKALGHDYQAEVTAPTCTAMGYSVFTCSRCGDSYKGEYTEATGHSSGDWIIDKEPTTTSEGSRHKECETCGKKLETEPIEKIYNQATTDTHGEAIVGGYLVTVTDTDTKNPVSGALVTLHTDNTLSIRLPDSRLLDYGDQTTITVQLVKDKSPVADMPIDVTDKNGNFSEGKTDKAGRFTVPGTSGVTNDDGKVTVGWEDADRDRWTLTVKVEDFETKRPIAGAGVSIGRTGNITVTLPDGEEMDENNRITVTVTDNKKQPQEGLTVIVKGDLGQSEQGQTDEDGQLTVPAVFVSERHKAYIVGYPDGTFGPERSMTRSEAAAIFARLLADKNGDTITTTAKTKFTDIPADAWYSGYVKYLTGFGVVYGRGENTFAPNDAITRAEFTAFAVRFFEAYGDGNGEIMEQYSSFDDVSSGYWAAEYIKDAARHGWIHGYGDGTFRADRYITRAEVVTIVNRLLGRFADEAYIGANRHRLNTFSDIDSEHWAFYDVMEAANTHTATMNERKAKQP
ncbi:MAG: S-layer homology domain-containing protein [Oscillospiraceae bacterium]